jgi:hypothetical protein
MKLPYVLLLFIAIIISGCQHRLSMSEVQGEWAADSAFAYLNIRGDSVTVRGRLQSVVLHRTLGPVLGYVNEDNELVIQPSANRRDTLCTLVRKGDELWMVMNFHNAPHRVDRGGTDSIPVYTLGDFSSPLYRLRRMVPDSSITITKVQFSASACLGDCPVFDAEFRSGEVFVCEPRGAWSSGYPIGREHFRSTFPPSEFAAMTVALKRGLLRDSKTHFERNVMLEWDTPAYGLAVFYNDTVVVVRYDHANLPPELTPFLPFVEPLLTSGHVFAGLAHMDTSILFRSRLCLMTDYDDSLVYLEGVNKRLYRGATYPGGDDSFGTYMREKLGSLASVHGTFSFYVTIGASGYVEDVRPAHWRAMSSNASPYPDPKPYLEAIRSSPRWHIPLYEGKPTRVTRFVCFYNEGE